MTPNTVCIHMAEPVNIRPITADLNRGDRAFIKPFFKA